MATLGPLMGVEAFLDGSGMNPNEDQEFLQNINPQPINPLNRNQFDSNEYGLQTQVNDQTFTPDPGMTLQDMLAQRDLQNSFPSTSPLSFQYTQPQGIAFNNPVGGLDQYAKEMEALEAARGGQKVSVNELGGTLQDFYTNRNPGTNANTRFEVIDDNINFNTQPQKMDMMTEYFNSIDNKATGPNIVQDASEIAQQAKVFGLKDLQGIGALEKGKVFGYNTTDQGDALEKFRENATSMNQGDFYKGANVQSLFDQLLQNENKNATQNQGYLQNVINQGFLENQTDFTKQKSLEDFT